jgi:ribonuclease-3 family protein
MEDKEYLSKEEILNLISSPINELEVKRLNPLVLAYIGDAVFELYIRKYLIITQGTLVNQLHKQATKFVKAEAQAYIVHNITDSLTEEEITIVKRGRNSKSGSVPKNADLSDYKYATGFEALIGYLYLIGSQERLINLISEAIRQVEGN